MAISIGSTTAGALFAALTTAFGLAHAGTFEENQQQRIQDARSMVSNSWVKYRSAMRTVMLAYKCNVVDRGSMSVAVGQIQGVMNDTVARAGLSMDSTFNIKSATDEVAAGVTKDTAAGICDQLTPEWRGNALGLVRALMPVAR